MISAILMLRRLVGALRVALREEDFARILGAGLALIIIGTLAYSLGADWSIVDGLYVAVATLTTSSILDPDLTVTDPWLKVFTARYVLVGIGIGVGPIPQSPGEWLPAEAAQRFLAYFMIAVTIIVVAVPEGLALRVTKGQR